MKKISLLLIIPMFLVLSQTAVAKDVIIEEVESGKTYNFSKQNVLELGKYKIIEYPEAPRKPIELQINNKPVFTKEGARSAIFHENSNLPVVMLDDTDNDGIPDRLTYDVYDKNGKLESSLTDSNLDGQLDLKLDIKAKTQYVWLNNNWIPVKEFGRDSNGSVIRKIMVKGKWKNINFHNYPFIIEK